MNGREGSAPAGPDPDEVELECRECRRRFPARTGWLPICPECFDDLREMRRPHRNRESEGARRRRET